MVAWCAKEYRSGDSITGEGARSIAEGYSKSSVRPIYSAGCSLFAVDRRVLKPAGPERWQAVARGECVPLQLADVSSARRNFRLRGHSFSVTAARSHPVHRSCRVGARCTARGARPRRAISIFWRPARPQHGILQSGRGRAAARRGRMIRARARCAREHSTLCSTQRSRRTVRSDRLVRRHGRSRR